MNNPIQWLRVRISRMVEQSVAESIQHENLVDLRAEVQELNNLVRERGWQNYVETFLGDASRHLNEVDQRTQVDKSELLSLMQDLSRRFSIQASQIRARPFQNGSLNIPSVHDGRETLGFSDVSEGTYVDFVNLFRPSFAELQNQLEYLTPFMPTTGAAVDLGAGRGEMVAVMKSHGLDAFGVDADKSVVEEAQSRGLDVRLKSIDDFLKSCESDSLDVVTSIQVVEHVAPEVLESWLAEMRRVLKSGGLLFLETPNPHAIDAFKAFWLDVTHVRPYYPEALLHLVQAAGFSSAEIWVDGVQPSVHDRLEYAGSYTLIAKA